MTVLDEAQLKAIEKANACLLRDKLNRAMSQYIYHLKLFCWKRLVLHTREFLLTKNFHLRFRLRLRTIMFRFWLHDTRNVIIKRRRKVLAEIMGCYAIKARCFARIHLFNYNTKRIAMKTLIYDQSVKNISMGLFHLKESKRIISLRCAYHRLVFMIYKCLI